MEFKIGDLVRVRDCPPSSHPDLDPPCECFFCATSSNRIGLILGPAPNHAWAVQFDVGQWRLHAMDFEREDAELISGTA